MNTTSPSTDAPAPPGTRPGQRQRRRVPVRATLLVLVLAAGSLAVVVAGRGPRFGPPPPLLAVPLDESGQRDGAVDGRSAESDGNAGEARLWTSHEHLRSLPMEGPAWEAVAQAAEQPLDGRRANLAHRNLHASQTFATALVAARTDSDRDRARVRDALRDVVAQEPDPAFDRDFREWLRAMLAFRYAAGGGGGTLVEVHERRANNFGTHAGASRVAAAAYLGDDAELARAATVFKGWLGDRDSYTGFVFGRGSWQHDPRRPVGINPVGAERDGHSIDGVLPDDQRRSGRFRWPPKRENYVWGALQGAVAQAHLLARQGYAAWAWEDEALRRAVTWLHVEADYPAEGDDVWVVPLVNAAYGTRFEVAEPGASESYGFTAWTHPAADGRP